ncbi:class I SAM-dependent methyltransferase [Amycolatopsis sp. NPDC051045]|uniref:class I SAM-dependent methyltransferase n=1 Tax=Amycolatopsis sp. NPDC051045 TaxID=3156922 RepID=UPI003432037F
MNLGELLHGKPQADAPGAISRAWSYEKFEALAFAGRRQRTFGRLVRLSGAKPGDQVLDVGCGPGYLTALAAGAVAPGGSAEGIDASASMIEQARLRRGGAGCSFRVGKAETLAAADGSFDVVLSSLMVHHLPEENRAGAFAEMFRVLRPGGHLLIAEFRPPRSRLGRHLVGATAGPVMRDNPIDRLAPMAREAGFEDVIDGVVRPFFYYVRVDKPGQPS